MPYIDFELVEVKDEHVTATDGIGNVHNFPVHMLEKQLLEELQALGSTGVGVSFTMFLNDEYCDINVVFI